MTVTSFPIEQHTCPNGLRVVVSPDHAAPVAAVNLWYNVGARHERPGRTGLAHLFEHLMFEGSRHLAAAEHFAVVTAAGGRTNATTSSERTNYFETVPSDQLDTALWLEADRLGSLLEVLTEQSLEKQRDVVRNERRQRVENAPYGSALGKLCAHLFPAGHPYAHETIGSMDDLAAATLGDVQDFFRAHYGPDNAVLTVVGDVSPEHVVARVEHYFGGIPPRSVAGEAPSRALSGPVPPAVHETIVERVPDPAVFMGFRLPPEGDPRLDHVELAVTALAAGRGSAFRRRVVDGELAKSATAVVDRRGGGASVGTVYAVARNGVPLEKLQLALWQEVTRLAHEGPNADELDRAKAMIERQWLDRVGEIEGRADEISRCATFFGEPERVNQRLATVTAATANDVRQATAEHFLDSPPVVLWYEPATEGRPQS